MNNQPLDRDRITQLVSSIFAEDLHAKRVASLAGAAVGVLEGAALGIHAIGRALAMAEGLKGKHAVKQVDRMLSNEGIDVWRLFGSWVPFVVADRPEIVTALDWTEFDADNQSTIVLSMITSHGRATPLLWKTVTKSKLKGWRNEHEDVLLERFRQVLPKGVKATVLADRGFGDQALYELLKDQLDLDFVVRFRGIIKVTSADGETKPAQDWVPANGRPLLLRGAQVTKTRRQLGAVVCVKAKGMKEAWHLATSHGDRTGAEVVELNGKQDSIDRGLEFLRQQGIKIEPLGQEIRMNEQKCIQCGACTGFCPTGALRHERPSMRVVFEEDKCVACELCLSACLTRAMEGHFH